MRKIFCAFISILFLASIAMASSTGGTGSSQVCNGGPPTYCARTDRAIQPIATLQVPGVNVPFVGPDFGMRWVRATGPNTLAGFNLPNWDFSLSSADTVVQWDIYDSTICGGSGGYRFMVQTVQGAHTVPMEFCPKTFQVLQPKGIGASQLATNGYFDLPARTGSHADPGVLFGLSGTQPAAYVFPDAISSYGSADAIHPILTADFSTCPNLPRSIPSSGFTSPAMYTDSSDRYFETSVMYNQNVAGFSFRYDKSTGNCLWFDPRSWTYGGTGITSTHVNGGPIGDSTSQQGSIPAPNCAASTTTGTIPAGTYKCEITYSVDYPNDTLGGESVASAETTVTLSAPGEITVTPQTCTDLHWCPGFGANNVQPLFRTYLTPTNGASGTETLQDYVSLGTGNGTITSFSGNVRAGVAPQDTVAGAGSVLTFDDGGSAPTSGALFNYSTSSAKQSLGTVTYATGAVSLNFANAGFSAPANGVNVFAEWWNGQVPPGTNQFTPSSDVITSLGSGGPNPPVANTGGAGIHTSTMTPDGNWFFFEGEGTTFYGNVIMWNIGTNTTWYCTLHQGCVGHPVIGYSKIVTPMCFPQGSSLGAGAVPYCNLETGSLAYNPSIPFTLTDLLSSPPYSSWPSPGFPPANQNQHIAWINNLNGGDNVPWFELWGGVQNIQPSSPLEQEGFSGSLTYPASAYRFMHPRADSVDYVGDSPAKFTWGGFGTTSQDGKYATVSTDMNGTLGWEGYAPSNVLTWQATHAYSAKALITDTQGNLEIETVSSCTSGSSVPTWPALAGSVSDGTCTWFRVMNLGTPNTGLVWSAGSTANLTGYYAAGETLIDSNGGLEQEITSTCIAGTPSHPTWKTIVGQITPSDGTCNWDLLANLGASVVGVGPIQSRVDVFIVELK